MIHKDNIMVSRVLVVVSVCFCNETKVLYVGVKHTKPRMCNVIYFYLKSL